MVGLEGVKAKGAHQPGLAYWLELMVDWQWPSAKCGSLEEKGYLGVTVIKPCL